MPNQCVCVLSVSGLERNVVDVSNRGVEAGLTVKEWCVNERGQADGGLDLSSPDGLSQRGHLLSRCVSAETSSLPFPWISQIKLGSLSHLSMVDGGPAGIAGVKLACYLYYIGHCMMPKNWR